MKIIIVGCGNVGFTLADQLSREGHDITAIDLSDSVIETLTTSCDVMGVVGNGASFETLNGAGIGSADLLIAVTGSDEINLLSCLFARKSGGCNTIARISNPIYNREIPYIKEELGLSLVINPELASAVEAERLLKFPTALKVDSFAKSRVELVTYKIEEGSPLSNVVLKDMSKKLNCDVLITAVERGDEVIIPNGDFMLKSKDEISVVGTKQQMLSFFKSLGKPTSAARDVLILGGGRTAYYLASMLIDLGVKVKIIEKDPDRCSELTDMLPKAMIICGDATDKSLLSEEGISTANAIVATTGIDEVNIMISLYAKNVSSAKLITKVHRISYDEIVGNLDLGSIINPKNITAEIIIKYVRAMKNSIGSNIETLYRLNENRIEALEFLIGEDSPIVGIPLSELKLKSDILIACITHKGKVTIPNGQSVIEVGDTLVLVTTRTGMNDIKDAL